MSNYKVGDLASLMSSSTAKNKPGSKLQSLFDEHWKRKGNPNSFEKAKKMKTQLKESPPKFDGKRKRKKKNDQNSSIISSPPNSPMKKTETDFNSDFLPIHNKKKQFKENNSTVKRKRKNSFTENSATENEKQSAQHSKNVTGFIRCSKNKRQKTVKQESADTMSVEPDHVQQNLFSEIAEKKQKVKKKSKQSHQNFSNGHGDTEEQESDTTAVEPDLVEETLFREKSHNNKKKKQKVKSGKSKQNSRSDPSSLGTEEQEDDSSKNNAEKNRLQDLKDLPHTLFVGNLPVSVNRKMLHKWFASFGQIKSARLRGAVSTKLSIPKKVAEIKNDYHKDLQSRTGFVVFSDEESAKKALTLNGTLIDSHHIVVDFANQAGEKKHYNNDLSVFLGNLPFDIDDESVRSAFEECGEIHAIRIIRDRDTGLGKGFGYVQFQKIKSKEKALSLEDLEINGRKIRVKPIESEGGKKAGPKKTVMMIRKNMAMNRIKEKGNKKSVKKLLKKGKQVHKKKQIARLLGEKFVK